MPPQRSGLPGTAGDWLLAAGAGLVAAYTLGGHAAGKRRALRRRPELLDAVALTFDDGPDPRGTPAILECLVRYGVPAAFFMVGTRAAAHRDLVRRVLESGCEVGNHGYAHRHHWTLSPWGTAREIGAGADAVADAGGARPAAFRPPWGIMNAATVASAEALGQRVVLWSVRSEGLIWRPTAPEMAAHIARETRGGDIFNLHNGGGFPDTPQRVLAALPEVISRLRDAGLLFVPLSAFL
jgi:peptidoglycan/xylan/chitin deacetylase (PgdA/CDA1 family)